MNLSFLLPKTRRDFAAAGERLQKMALRGVWGSSNHTNAHENLTAEFTDGHKWEKRRAAPGEPELALSSQNPSTSKLANAFESTSLIRSTDAPAGAALPLMDDSGVLASDCPGGTRALALGCSTLEPAVSEGRKSLGGVSGTEQPRHWGMLRKHIEDGSKGAANKDISMQSHCLHLPVDLAVVQLERIRDVWRDAVADVPYYSRLVAGGRAPGEIRSWEDFFSIPELTREILQDSQKEFARRSGPPNLWRMTGGSTGNPVKFGVWKSEDEVIRVLKLVLWRRVGYRPSDRLFMIWGHSHLLGTGWRRHWNHHLRKAKDVVLGYKRVDAYALSGELCEQYAMELLRYRPAGLIGYSAALDFFVRALPERWAEFRALGLKFVMPCAEPAPREDSFELLGRVFGCPVIQEFGGVDFGHVGMKLGEEPFVVFGEENFVELAEPPMAADLTTENKKDSEGESGDLKLNSYKLKTSLPEALGAAFVTSLYRRYLPLIRYRQGDVLGGVRRLAHGHVASFERLQGRVNDMVLLEDGTAVHSVAVFHCTHQEPAVLNIQMILEDAGPKILLVTRGEIDAALEGRIRHRLGQIARLLAQARIERVEDLLTTRAGKRRWVLDLRTN